MTGEQMFFGVSIPVVIFMTGVFLSNRSLSVKIEGLSLRFDGVDGRLDRIDGRMDRIDGRIDRIEGRLDRIEGSVALIQGDLRTFHHVTGKLEGRLDEISKR